MPFLLPIQHQSTEGRKGIRPVKTECWDAGMVICLGRVADLHMAKLMPLPLTISCSVNPDWFYLPGFTFLVPAYPGNLGQSPGGCKMVVVVVVVVVILSCAWRWYNWAAWLIMQLVYKNVLNMMPSSPVEVSDVLWCMAKSVRLSLNLTLLAILRKFHRLSAYFWTKILCTHIIHFSC